jgi:hypothetical protein
MRRSLIFAAIALALLSFPARASLFKKSAAPSKTAIVDPVKSSALRK